MTLLLVLIGVFLLLIFGSLLFAMLVFSRARTPTPPEATKQTPAVESLSFRWKCVALPIAVLLLTIVMVAWFYGRLPAEVAYRFTDDGTPDAWATRGMLLVWALLPQVLLTLLAAGMTWGVARIGRAVGSIDDPGITLHSLRLVMGNMIALPQLVLGFAMLNTFSYNAYQSQFVPLWLVAIIIMVLAAVSLGIFFTRGIRGVRGVSRDDPHQENPEERR